MNKKMKPGESLEAHLTTLCQLRQERRLVSIKGDIDNEDWQRTIINPLPNNYHRTFLDTLKTSDKLIRALLREEEHIRFEQGERKASASALQASSSRSNINSSLKCENCNRPGNLKKTCWAPGGDQENNPPDFIK